MIIQLGKIESKLVIDMLVSYSHEVVEGSEHKATIPYRLAETLAEQHNLTPEAYVEEMENRAERGSGER